jgi:hypothetical protein
VSTLISGVPRRYPTPLGQAADDAAALLALFGREVMPALANPR